MKITRTKKNFLPKSKENIHIDRTFNSYASIRSVRIPQLRLQRSTPSILFSRVGIVTCHPRTSKPIRQKPWKGAPIPVSKARDLLAEVTWIYRKLRRFYLTRPKLYLRFNTSRPYTGKVTDVKHQTLHEAPTETVMYDARAPLRSFWVDHFNGYHGYQDWLW